MTNNIAIVGAGIGGLACAWGLTRAGHAVTLYEQHTVGAGASGLALGALAAFGPHVRGNLARVQRESVIVRWPLFVDEISAATDIDLATFYRCHPTNPDLAQLNVPIFLQTLTQALRQGLSRRNGVKAEATIVENIPVTDPTKLLKHHEKIILAAGWGNEALIGQNLRLDAGQAIRVSVPPDIWPHIPLTYDHDHKLYLVPGWTPADGLAIGSASWSLNSPGDGRPDPAISADLLARAITLQPLLAHATITHQWVGYRPSLRGGLLPLLRPTHHPQIHAVTGLGKLGFCLAPALVNAAQNLF